MWIPEQTFVSSNKTYLIIEYKTCGFVDKRLFSNPHVLYSIIRYVLL